jgi:hypothetical protein
MEQQEQVGVSEANPNGRGILYSEVGVRFAHPNLLPPKPSSYLQVFLCVLRAFAREHSLFSRSSRHEPAIWSFPMYRLISALMLTALLAACGGTTATDTGVSGTVSIDPQLVGQVSPDDTVFIFARRPEGPPMPLAILRLQVSDLPHEFRLDDSHAMTDQGLSSVDQVLIVARVSRTGQAMPASGDLEGQSGTVSTGTRDLEIVIDRVRP